MPVTNSPQIERLANGATVVTATKHLARAIKQQFDRQQVADGKQAWESADVLSYNAWLRRAWSNFCHLPAQSDSEKPQHPLLLNDLQVVAAWESIVEEDIRYQAKRAKNASELLWNPHTTARSAVSAWKIINEWRINLDRCALSNQDDHQCMLRWTKQFQKLCAERNWIDPYCVINRIIELLKNSETSEQLAAQFSQSSSQIEWCGFDSLLPQQQWLVETLQNAGVQVEVTLTVTPTDESKSSSQNSELHDYENQANQWLSAAQWAREKLLKNPDAKLAIVAPNMQKAAPAIEHALKQILSPQQLIAPTTSTALPYHISLGKKLIQYPLVNAAVVALTPLAADPNNLLPRDSICQLLLSPFLYGAEKEVMARAQLENWCRQRLPYQIRFKRFLKEISDRDFPRPAPHCPLLLKALNDAVALADEDSNALKKSNTKKGNTKKKGNQKQPISHWAQRFSAQLEQLGWPGKVSLNSDEYQAVRAFREQLQQLSTLELTAPPITAATALAWFRRRLNEQPFQVEEHHASVQVLDVFEAAGQQFDGLWFGNLIDTEWPPMQYPNPFIPPAAQREVRVFAACLVSHRKHFTAIHQRITECSDETILSYPRMEEDIPTQISPLIAELLKESPDSVATPTPEADIRFNTPANILHANKPTLEEYVDIRGPGFDPDSLGNKSAGGVSVIENQAKCPFRAFAIYRLGARATETKQQGLAVTERGSLIHHALYLVWGEIRSSEKLSKLSDKQLQDIIHSATEQSCKRYQFLSGCGEKFDQTQMQWVNDTVSEWLEVEKTRNRPFVVRDIEEKFSFTLNDLPLSFKIDRVDELSGGENNNSPAELAVIDYKTGATNSATNWRGERPQSPQLPLYALALDPEGKQKSVATVAYAQVKKGQCHLIGVTRHEEADDKVVPLHNSSLKNEFDDWKKMIDHWHEDLSILAEEFLAGEARVDPLPNACRYCDLHGFCRIDESTHAELEEAE